MLDRNEIRATLIELMEADTGGNYANVEETNQLRTELGLDSVDVVSIISQVERRFRIRLSQEDLEKLVTFGDVLDLLQKKLNDADSAPRAA
jgi:acyl carrier protein